MYLSTNKLKTLRSENGWSQEVLARSTGLSVRTIQRIEAEGKASAESTLALASVFNLSPQALKATSNEIEVNWTRRMIMKNLLALLLISGAIVMLIILGASVKNYIDVVSGIFLILFLYSATIVTFGSSGFIKSLCGLKYLFTEEMNGGSQAKHLSEVYESQIKFLYGGALVGMIAGAIAIFGNIDNYENFALLRALAVNLVVLFYAAILSECVFRPLSIKLKTCDISE
ncbi:transcriptional regulator [Pseudoalteromonas luteoviolacea]|uniref:Transcriptional regulator n=1 Tax=Pseudoalteromonas luteoviolacea TaxID=43657 RepID=A0A1C0TW35_9GAMM|nr:helix-turn-helix transcriptional regulator [Pseudoalteromonas luteoviolacea]MBQ4810060.1 helix-turn-helix transcriptional regulator [Pseudoalteromonas luteoviolacea]OCQ23538.1 transcriptional regulator [Pseudoalteromonas luteoviolacea]